MKSHRWLLLCLLALGTTCGGYSFSTRTRSVPPKNTGQQQPRKQQLIRGFLNSASAALILLAASTSSPVNAIDSSLVEGQLPALNPSQRRYMSIMSTGSPSERSEANEKLIDHAVGTINTMYYDNSGGNNFDTRSFYDKWKALRSYARDGEEGLEKWKETYARRMERERADWVDIGGRGDPVPVDLNGMPERAFETRDNTVESINWLVSTLRDPFSKYLTKEQLFGELEQQSNGLLGLGAIVEPPQISSESTHSESVSVASEKQPLVELGNVDQLRSVSLLSAEDASTLPVVTAVSPNSPAEREGIVVGDRIVAVGPNQFLGSSRDTLLQKLQLDDYKAGPNDYLTIAKPIIQSNTDDSSAWKGNNLIAKEKIVGYKLSRMFVHSPASSSNTGVGAKESQSSPDGNKKVIGGDAVVRYELLTPSDSIFRKLPFEENTSQGGSVGYIRLSRFSRAATAGYINAIEQLEAAGAQSYIIDVRNNYGGIIQEAMLTASTLLRDPHAVLCYTLNSRGGFTPHDGEEYIIDKRYPGYLLSSEPSSVTLEQVKRDDPEFYEDGGASWMPPSAYASLHEQRLTRKIRLASDKVRAEEQESLRAQKKIVILINEGTASAAEVFASSLHDNGRTVALVGSKTYGKGLIQHTFPMPDGGGLRLTVAEYLTPALQHVTKVGNARYDPYTGDLVGGGIRPDVYCSSRQGIPTDVGADLCVGIAFDILEDAEAQE